LLAGTGGGRRLEDDKKGDLAEAAIASGERANTKYSEYSSSV
jgi:hypothetical protein